MIAKGSIFLALFICAAQDMRKKQVTIRRLVIAGLLITIGVTVGHAWNLQTVLGGLFIGGLVMLLGRVTGGIGMADGIVLCMTGLRLGAIQNVILFFEALVLAAVVSTFLLIYKKKPKNYEVPFLPFLCLAFVAHIAMGLV